MDRRGFTLVELLVALTLGAVVVLLGHRVFGAVVEGAARVRAAQAAADREANGRRWLVEAFGSLGFEAPGAVGGGEFEGVPGRVRFATWLPTATGGLEPRRVELAVTGDRLVATINGQDSLVLRDGVGTVGFDYLLEPGANARWVGEWRSPVSAPLAVRLRLTCLDSGTGAAAQTDTLLFLIGARG